MRQKRLRTTGLAVGPWAR